MELKVRHQGEDHFAEVQVIKTTIWVHYNGRTFCVDGQPLGRRRRKGGAGNESDKVLAPMPGKITKVLVASGEAIEKGQPALVMEAMKMEYTLKAECSGIVTNIFVQIGEQVPLGKNLIQIESVKS